MARVLIFYLCSLTLRSLALALVTGLITIGVRNVARQHAIWTTLLGCIILMPAADALLPTAFVPARVPDFALPMQTFVVLAPQTYFPTAAAAAHVLPKPVRDWWSVAACLIVFVAVSLLFRLALACRVVLRMKRTSRPVSIPLWIEMRASYAHRSRTPDVRESNAVTTPLTVGLWQPVLILPPDWRVWASWKLRAVLSHEWTHVRRFDWAITIMAEIVRCVFWFNPLTWWLERRLSSLAEQASDEACVLATGDAARYAETLLEFASAAKHGHRWMGGIAMAQHKVRFRIERVLALRHAGPGILSRVGWLAVVALTIPLLFVSATAQSLSHAEIPALSAEELLRVVEHFPASASSAVAMAGPQQPAPAVSPAPPNPPLPAREVPQPQSSPNPQAVPVAPGVPTTTNPDLVGEIRLILAPVDQGQGAVEVRTNAGTNRWTGTARWVDSIKSNSFLGANDNAFIFALTGVQNRALLFEDAQGRTSSYGCADCSFLKFEGGVSGPSSVRDPGMIFQLSADGNSLTVTCRAVECHVGSSLPLNWANNNQTFLSFATRSLRNSESMTLGVRQLPPSEPKNPGLVCFSVFGNIKADGTPFTDADCPGGRALVQTPSVLIFSVTR